ncbi:6,7-dimethyl-8-ribityllumazine synthase [Arcticibacter svalbardensis MN12-7]|uniref:6,7-dimethyl-8-ribityllumazine synthase n=1 Tax=Arcticibacter svalbardensis MN12-7 TaxID=1150600 RepID=R9GUL9_9SPHI|nr:6,7-dimethyl-8-ribityllumazine synthase [Arcticibacter svalbardensis]EOR92609.1 6,7-dimethyl-8-ribityllumazine synthase [Arcticibacter svalbardensis MN12-7]
MATHLKNLSDFSHTTIPSAESFRFAIVTAQWNADITGALYQGAYDMLIQQGTIPENILSFTVPGSFELIVAAEMVLNTQQVDAVICLGCIIQGDTPHFEYICNAVANGISNVGIKHAIPVIFGVLTTLNLEQAQERAGGKHGNKGTEAAASAILMADLQRLLK